MNLDIKRNETDINFAKQGILALMQARETFRREDGSVIHRPGKPLARASIKDFMTNSKNTIDYFTKQGADQGRREFFEATKDKPSPYCCSENLVERALVELCAEGLLQRNGRNNYYNFQLTEKGRKVEIPEAGALLKNSLAFTDYHTTAQITAALGAVLGTDNPLIARITEQLKPNTGKAVS